ncbi:MAG: hypothetical protein ACO3F5_06890 [Gemmatimonadaceae bacterium]
MRHSTTIRLALTGLSSLVLATAASAQDAAIAAPSGSGVRAPAALRGAGPNGATLKCRDGSHPAANAPMSACDGRGGVLLRYPMLRTPASANASANASAVVRAPAPPRPVGAPRQPTVRGALTPTVPLGPPPVDATMACRDGTMIRRDTTTAACASHGGIALRFRPRPN